MNICLSTGLDNLVFGMIESEVISTLGEPNKIVVSTFGNRELLYYKFKLALKIEPENDDRLGWIGVHNRDARWNSHKIWNIDKEQLLSLLAAELEEGYTFDDYGNMESFSFKESWVELQYEFGELYSFNFGVRYDGNNLPIWPKESPNNSLQPTSGRVAAFLG